MLKLIHSHTGSPSKSLKTAELSERCQTCYKTRKNQKKKSRGSVRTQTVVKLQGAVGEQYRCNTWELLQTRNKICIIGIETKDSLIMCCSWKVKTKETNFSVTTDQIKTWQLNDKTPDLWGYYELRTESITWDQVIFNENK